MRVLVYAEDMEFSECCKSFIPELYRMRVGANDGLFVVDAAAAERDPHRRIAFVAAFAMSNYSSTIGRIAKPFNPMLVRFSSFPPALFPAADSRMPVSPERDVRVRPARQAVPLRL